MTFSFLGRPFVAALILLGLLTSACGTGAPESLAFATNDSERTVIRFATPRIDGFEAAIADWEREHPTVDVEVVLTNDTNYAASVDIIAFEGADSALARDSAESFVDLSDLVDEDFRDSFLPTRWQEGVADSGELIGLPVDTDIQMLFVRRDLASTAILNELRNAQTWCDVIAAGNEFVDSTNTAFLADGEELLRAMLTQSRTSLTTSTGQIDPEAFDELQRVWNIAMLAVGADIVGDNPCGALTETGPILRDLTPGESVWLAEIASDDFGAVISSWSTRARIAQAYPASVDQWATISLPIDNATSTTTGSSSESGLHLSISNNSNEVDVALDLILTLTNPIVQSNTFRGGQGPLPAALDPYENGTVENAEDSFFTGTPSIGAIASETVLARPNSLSEPERQMAVDALVASLAEVQGLLQTPEEAWGLARSTIEVELLNN